MQNIMQKNGGDKGIAEAEEDNLKNMGEGSEKMVQSMMFEMPLQSIVTFGRMTEEELNGLLNMLNS